MEKKRNFIQSNRSSLAVVVGTLLFVTAIILLGHILLVASFRKTERKYEQAEVERMTEHIQEIFGNKN